MLKIWLILTATCVVAVIVQSPWLWLLAALILPAFIVARAIRELWQCVRGRRRW